MQLRHVSPIWRVEHHTRAREKMSMQGLLPPCIPDLREMTRYNNTVKMPFAVSLTLIFGYSLLQVMVPTEPYAVNAEVATSTDTEPSTASPIKPILVTTSSNEPATTVH